MTTISRCLVHMTACPLCIAQNKSSACSKFNIVLMPFFSRATSYRLGEYYTHKESGVVQSSSQSSGWVHIGPAFNVGDWMDKLSSHLVGAFLCDIISLCVVYTLSSLKRNEVKGLYIVIPVDKLDKTWIEKVEASFHVDLRISTASADSVALSFIGSRKHIAQAERYIESILFI